MKGYLFPKRALQDEEILEPDALNEDFLPAAARLSGGLNEHNFNANSIRLNAAVDEHGLYEPHFVSIEADPHFGVPGAYLYPDATDPNAWQIPNSFDWDVVDGMTLSFNTGNVVLYIIGWLQYVWLGFDMVTDHDWSNPGGANNRQAHVQFALRIDGTILDGTVTGQKDISATSWYPLFTQAQRDATTLLPGPQSMRNQEDNAALGPEILPVRMGIPVPVSQGRHTIEIVARRIMPNKFSSDAYAEDDTIYVYNRKLFVLETDIEAQNTSSDSSVTVEYFEPEDDFDAAAMQTDRIDAIRNASNAIPSGGSARGAFNHNHVPNALLDSYEINIAPAAFVTGNSRYPGFTSDLQSPFLWVFGGAAGWWRVENGAGKILYTDDASDPHGPWTLMGQKCFIVVLANVHLVSIVSPAVTRYFGAFSIGYRRGGVNYIDDSSIAFANSYAFCTADPNAPAVAEHIDVPLMAFIDGTSGLAINNIDWFAVYESSMTPAAAAVDMLWQQGNLIVLKFRY
jgi:hypothetical protein